eukprot:6214629-Amphidinium_carterae.1
MDYWGHMTPEQATAKYQELGQEPGAITDYDNPKNEFQIRVATGKEVDFTDEFAKSRAMETDVKRVKNAKPEDLHKLEEKVRSGVSNVLGSERMYPISVAFQLAVRSLLSTGQEVARASSGSGSAFEDSTIRLGDVKRLFEEAEAAAEEKKKEKEGQSKSLSTGSVNGAGNDSGDDDSQNDEDEKSNAGDKKSSKKECWFDRDRQVAKALRQEICMLFASSVCELAFFLFEELWVSKLTDIYKVEIKKVETLESTIKKKRLEEMVVNESRAQLLWAVQQA